MYKVTFECETITPMFLAGADPRTPELRAPSIKGALRFWWRAMHGHLPLNQLREEEAKIFGGVEKDQGKSAFSIVVTGKFQSSSTRFPRQTVQITSRGRTFPINILEYLAYGTYQYRKGQGNVFIRDYIPPKSQFTVTLLSLHQELIEDLKNLFFIFTNFSGLGSRSRNGFGNFGIKNAAELGLKPIDFKSFKSRFNGTDIFGFTGFSKKMRILKTKKEFDSWDQALAEIGKAYREARGKLEPKHKYDKRQYLGAPIVVNKRTVSILERRAKPFFIHIQKTQSNKHHAYFFYLPSRYCEGLDKDRNGHKIDHRRVNIEFLTYTEEFVNIMIKNPNLIEIN